MSSSTTDQPRPSRRHLVVPLICLTVGVVATSPWREIEGAVRGLSCSATVLFMVDTEGRSSLDHADESPTAVGGGRWWRHGELPGTEPDARFTFANERTFLAWNRTALGCVVAGLAVWMLSRPVAPVQSVT